MNNILAILALPRTGTNHICSLLNQSKNITYNTEDFNGALGVRFMKPPIKSYIIEQWNSDINKNLSSSSPSIIRIDHENIHYYIHLYPETYLKYLSDYGHNINIDNHYMLFKIFHDHIPIESIVKLFFIDHKEIKKIIIKRDLLETFVSFQIANETNKWYNVNTSNKQVTINIQTFRMYYTLWKQYYDILDKYKDDNTIIISYENVNALSSSTEQYQFLKEQLQTIGVILTDKKAIKTSFFKQNKTPLHKQIKNYNDVMDAYTTLLHS